MAVSAAERGDKLFRFQILPVDHWEQTKILKTYLHGHSIVSANSDILPTTGTVDTRKKLRPHTLGIRLFRGIYDSVYIVGPDVTIRKKQVVRLSFGGWDYSISFPLPGGGDGTMSWKYDETGIQMPSQTLHSTMPDKPIEPTDKDYVSTHDGTVDVLHLKADTKEKFAILFLRCGIQVGKGLFQAAMVGPSENPQ